MTPLQALLLARQHGVTVRLVDARLHIGAKGPVPRRVIEVLRQHRQLLVEALGDPKWTDDWGDMAQAHLDAVESRQARPDQTGVRSCPSCHQAAWWQRADGGEVCGVCHSDPRVLRTAWEAHHLSGGHTS